MSGSKTTESPQVELIRSFAQGYEKKDPDHLAKHCHRDLRRVIYPRSLGLPEETKEQWLERITELMSFWTSCEIIFHSIIEAPGKVIAHVTAKANTSIGLEMIRELIYIASIAPDEDGSLKIMQFEEFTDSKSYLEFYKVVAAAKAGKESASLAA